MTRETFSAQKLNQQFTHIIDTIRNDMRHDERTRNMQIIIMKKTFSLFNSSRFRCYFLRFGRVVGYSTGLSRNQHNLWLFCDKFKIVLTKTHKRVGNMWAQCIPYTFGWKPTWYSWLHKRIVWWQKRILCLIMEMVVVTKTIRPYGCINNWFVLIYLFYKVRRFESFVEIESMSIYV